MVHAWLGLLVSTVWSTLAVASLAGLAAGYPAQAQEVAPGTVDTLEEALVRTYETNPTLLAERARLRATDEEVALARSEGRPRISSSAGLDRNVWNRNTAGTRDRSLEVGADVNVPLYAGGRVRNAVRAADMRVASGRADLRSMEADLLTEAAAAYMDVLRDRAILELNENQVRVLQSNLEGSEARYEAGDLTRTDVAQSEARLALAVSSLGDAEGQLEASEENYRRVIGVRPGSLAPPPPLPGLPATPEDAADAAVANNPDLASVQAAARAADFDIDTARGARLPTISATGGTRYLDGLGSSAASPLFPDTTAEGTIGLLLTLPLYQGGEAGARVRRAQAVHSEVLEQSVAIERSVIAEARVAFAGLRAARRAIDANTVAVTANELALEGTRAEQMAGTRTILDVLNAEQELVNSEVALVAARRDAYVAAFRLLNAMGLAEAEDLSLDVGAIYDPAVNYDRYSGDWSDWREQPR